MTLALLRQHPPFTVVGDATAMASALDRIPNRFYVYLLLKPNGAPFYVGKGVLRRALQHEAEARNTIRRSHKLNVIRSIVRRGERVLYGLAGSFETETEAHHQERMLIQSIGRHDLGSGPLTNQTDGGEGASNPSEESRVRRAATLGGASNDPDRRAINEFFNSIAGQQDSVPIKPLGARALEPTTPHPSPRSPKSRMAVTLVAAALANELSLRPGVRLPRTFRIGGKPYAIENGVSRDMLKAGMIDVEPASQPEKEVFVLTETGFSAVLRLLGQDRLLDLGAIDPL